MQCQHAQELFSDYVAGGTDRALTITIENHLSGCDRCRDEVSGLRRVWSALDELPVAEPPLYFHENILSRVNAVREEEARAAAQRTRIDWRGLFKPRALAMAASILLVLFFATSHAMRADLDPLGAIIRLFHPAPPATLELAKPTAEWSTLPQGGDLTIHLQAVPNSNGTVNRMTYQVEIPGKNTSSIRGVLASDQDTSVVVPLANAPANGRVSVVLSAVDGNGSRSVTIPVTDAAPVNP